MEPNVESQLTAEDKQARQQSEVIEKLGLQLPDGLAGAIASEVAFIESNGHLKRVKEAIFVRDILPAIAGELGPVSMTWWIKQFGAVTLGFLVVDNLDDEKILFEFPPMGPSNDATRNSARPPVGDLARTYLGQVYNNPGQASDNFKSEMREYMHLGDGVKFIENIARTERIMRYYGKTILTDAKPALVDVINGCVEGLDNVLGKIGAVETTSDSPVQTAQEAKKENSSYDDDGEASSESFD